MYRELEKNEGIELVLKYTKTYTCMKEEDPIYTQEKLEKFYAYPFNTIAFETTTENTKGVVGFMDDYLNENQLFLWVANMQGVKNIDDLREGIRESFQLLCDYANSRNKNILTTRVVKWKDYKPVWKGMFDNWKEIYTEVANEFFVDFKIEDEEVMVFKVK